MNATLFTKGIAVPSHEYEATSQTRVCSTRSQGWISLFQTSEGGSSVRMKDEAMGISGIRISGSVRMRVVSRVGVVRSVAIFVAAAEESRWDSVRSCGACEAMANEYAWSGAERDGGSAATGTLQARGTLAPGCVCDASSSVDKVGAVGPGGDGVADGVADDVVVAVLVGGEDDELRTLR